MCIAPCFAMFQCVFNVYSINIQLLQYVDIKCVLHHALQYFNVYSMYIQCILNVYSINIQLLHHVE